MCENVHVRARAQCWHEFAKCCFTHFPSFFSAHVDTYAMVQHMSQTDGGGGGAEALWKSFFSN